MKLFVAIHLVTESTDHYNYLIPYFDNDVSTVINVIKELGTELGCVSTFWVTGEDNADVDKIKELLSEAIAIQSEINHQEWLASLGE